MTIFPTFIAAPPQTKILPHTSPPWVAPKASAGFDLFPPVARATREACVWWANTLGAREADFLSVGDALHRASGLGRVMQGRIIVRRADHFSGFFEYREAPAAALERLSEVLHLLPPEHRRPPQDFLEVTQWLRSYPLTELELRVQAHFERIFIEVGELFFPAPIAHGEGTAFLAPLSPLRDAVFASPKVSTALAYLHGCDELLETTSRLSPPTRKLLQPALTVAASATLELHSHLLLLEAAAWA